MNLLVKRARERLFGKRSAALDPEQARENARLGVGNEDEWPRGAAPFNPIARRLTEEARRRTGR